jgi:hypothetical protein
MILKMAGRWRRTIIVGLLIGAACTKQLALLELLFQVSVMPPAANQSPKWLTIC